MGRKGSPKNGVKPRSRSPKIKFRRQSQTKQEANGTRAQAGLGLEGLQEIEYAQCLDCERAVSGLGQPKILARHWVSCKIVSGPKDHKKNTLRTGRQPRFMMLTPHLMDLSFLCIGTVESGRRVSSDWSRA